MNLAALTDCPAVSQFPQGVRHNLEGERVNFDHDRIVRQKRLGSQGRNSAVLLRWRRALGSWEAIPRIARVLMRA